MEIIIGISASLVASLIWFLLTVFFKPLSISLSRLSKKNKGTFEYTWRGKRVVKFDSKESTRVTIGVLGKIEHEKKWLLEKDKYGQYKPLGGAIKLDDDLIAKFEKLDNFTEDLKTKYRGKANDARFFVKIKDNKKIQKHLSNKTLNFYVNELKREISEELGVDVFKSKILEVKLKQPTAVVARGLEENYSPLQVREYIQQFIFEVKILNLDALNRLLKTKENFVWVDKVDRNINFSLTSQWLAWKNPYTALKIDEKEHNSFDI